MHHPDRIVRFAPPGAYTEPLSIRSYEVSRTGFPQPGTILRYLEYLATRASGSHGYTNTWYAEQGSAWLVREMSLLLGWLPPMDSELMMATWVAEFRRVQAFREYAIWHPTSGRMVARARARWAYVQRHTGQPLRVPDEMAALFGSPNSTTRLPVRMPQPTEDPLWRGEQTIVAREYEADVHQHINNCVYGDWLYEGATATLRGAGHAAGEVRPRFLTLEYLRQVRPGDQVRIHTTLHPDGSRRLRADQFISDAVSGDVILRGQTRYLTSTQWAMLASIRTS
ncbi:MAG TPA: acyl-ACP thioesterase domain-containing protein [Ktedonobacterales bacterium]|nr:acyl-ACP thioesterase domain-containing protein [Ktedonobacterales bacterium]